jgi:uncharacterized membrane protein
MRQTRQKRKSKDAFNIHFSLKISDRQLRTLQMFASEFGHLHEGAAIRHLIDTYMEPKLAKAMAPETSALAPKAPTKISSPATPSAIAAQPKKHWAPEPAVDMVDTHAVNDDDLMTPPLGNIGGSSIARDLVENEDINRKTRVARYEPDQDRYGSIEQD